MARYNTSESSSDLSRDESGDSVNRHSANEEEEVAEAPVVVVEEKDGSDIDGGNVDNFPAIPPGFSPTSCYKKRRNPPSPPIEFVSDEEEEDDESSNDTMLEASSSSSHGEGNGVEQD